MISLEDYLKLQQKELELRVAKQLLKEAVDIIKDFKQAYGLHEDLSCSKIDEFLKEE